MEHPISQLQGVICYIESHSVTCHPTQVNTARLNSSQRLVPYSVYLYPGGMEGWVGRGDRLRAEMVYPPTDGQPSKY